MNQVSQNSVNISAPNLLTICVNDINEGDMQGEFYHYYSEKPVVFYSVLDLIRSMEKLFDDLAFPQASTRPRSLVEKRAEEDGEVNRKEKLIPWNELLSHTGKKGTFITCVKFRQRSSWQGEIFLKEQERKVFFSSTLEFIRLLDQALNQQQKAD